MKKTFYVLLICCLCFGSMSACGSKKKDTTSSNTESTQEKTTENEPKELVQGSQENPYHIGDTITFDYQEILSEETGTMKVTLSAPENSIMACTVEVADSTSSAIINQEECALLDFVSGTYAKLGPASICATTECDPFNTVELYKGGSATGYIPTSEYESEAKYITIYHLVPGADEEETIWISLE